MQNFLRLGIAVKFSFDILATNEATNAQEHQESLSKRENERRRDLKSPPNVLLPLGLSPQQPSSQLQELITKIEGMALGLSQKFDCSITGKIAPFVTIMAVSMPRLLLSEYIPTNHMYIQLFFELVQLSVMIWLIAKMNQNSAQFLQTSINSSLLVITQQIEFTAIYKGRGAEAFNFFGTFELMAYLLILTRVAICYQTCIRVKQEEEGVLASQAVVNRLASTLFSDADETRGLAILHLGGAKDSFMSLLRYNRQFEVHLDGHYALGNGSAQSDGQDHTLLKQAMTRHLEHQLLLPQIVQSAQQTGAPNFIETRSQTFKTMLENAVKTRELGNKDRAAETTSHLLFTANIMAPSQEASSFEQSSRNPGQNLPGTILEIKTEVLCDQGRLYLVKIKGSKSAAKLEIKTKVASLSIIQEPRMVVNKEDAQEVDVPVPILKRKPQPKRVSFDSLQFYRADKMRQPMNNKHSRSTKTLAKVFLKVDPDRIRKPSTELLTELPSILKKRVSKDNQLLSSSLQSDKNLQRAKETNTQEAAALELFSTKEEVKFKMPYSPSVSTGSSQSESLRESDQNPRGTTVNLARRYSIFQRTQTMQPARNKPRPTKSTSSSKLKTLFKKSFKSSEEENFADLARMQDNHSLLEELKKPEQLQSVGSISPQDLTNQYLLARAPSLIENQSALNILSFSGSGASGSGASRSSFKKLNSFVSAASHSFSDIKNSTSKENAFLNPSMAANGPYNNLNMSDSRAPFKRSQTFITKKTNAAAAANSDNSKMFMFKIIHDLRHPTQAFNDGLQRIVESAESFISKNSQQGVIKGIKFLGDPRVDRTVNALTAFTKQLLTPKKAMVRGAVRRNKSTDSILPYIQRDTFLEFKELQQIKDCLHSRMDRVVGQDAQQKLKQIQDCFWNLPLQNFIIRPPPPPMQQQQQLEEVKIEESSARRSVVEIQQKLGLQEFIVERRDKSSSIQSIRIDDLDNSQPSESFQKKSADSGDIGESIVKHHHGDQIQSQQHNILEDHLSRAYVASGPIEESKSQRSQEARSKQESGLTVFTEDMKPLGPLKITNFDSGTFRPLEPPLSALKHSTDSALQHGQSNPERQVKNFLKITCRSDKSNDDLQLTTNSFFTDSGFSSESQSEKSEKNLLRQQLVSKGQLSVSKGQLSVSKGQLSQSKNSFEMALTQQSQVKLARQVRLLLSERLKLILLLESHMKKRLSIKKQCLQMQGYVEFMTLLLTDLMNFAMLKSNTFTLVKDYFDCTKLVKKCFKSLRMQCQMKGVLLTGPIFDKPIDSIYFRAIFGDEQRYKQIITNFLTNGIKFTPRNGSVSVLLRLIEIKSVTSCDQMSQQNLDNQSSSATPDKEDGSIPTQKSFVEQIISFQIIFRDSGCGISEENQGKLFASFSKIEENQDMNKQGVGLGLSICREIINANGGSIAVKSELGQGTDFIISLQTKCQVDIEDLAANNSQSVSEVSGSLAQSEWSSDSDEASYRLNSADGLSGISEQTQEMQQSQSHNSREFVKDESEEFKEVIRRQVTVKQMMPETLSVIDERCTQGQDMQGAPTAVLVANDCPFVLNSVKRMLSKYFEVVDTAENGQEAVDLVKSHPFFYYDAIVLDYNMPEMDGCEACVQILKHIHCIVDQMEETAKIPHLYALTQESNQEVVDMLLQAGFKDIISTMTIELIKMIMKDAGLEFKPIDRKKKKAAKLNSLIEESSETQTSDDSGY